MKNWKNFEKILEKKVIFWSRAFGPGRASKIVYRLGPDLIFSEEFIQEKQFQKNDFQIFRFFENGLKVRSL